MSNPVMHPGSNIFFFKISLAFIPCKNIDYRPDSTRLNVPRYSFVYLQTEKKISIDARDRRFLIGCSAVFDC